MFSDPQSLTVNAVSQTLPRTSTGDNKGTFTKDDGLYKLEISHQYGKRQRRLVRFTGRKVAADPFVTGVQKEYSMSVSLVIDHPVTGYTNAEAKQIVDALTAYLTASSGANVTKILGGES